jgi:hypothetical protein
MSAYNSPPFSMVHSLAIVQTSLWHIRTSLNNFIALGSIPWDMSPLFTAGISYPGVFRPKIVTNVWEIEGINYLIGLITVKKSG